MTCHRFWKVSALVYLLYKVTVWRAFQNVCLYTFLSRKLIDTRATPHLDQHARGRSPTVCGMDVCPRVQHCTYAGMTFEPRGPAERGRMMKMVTCLSEIRDLRKLKRP